MKNKIFGGRKIAIRELAKKDLRNANKFRDFINSFVEEDAQNQRTKKISLEEMRKRLREDLKEIKKHKKIYLIAEDKNKIIGRTSIWFIPGRNELVGNLNIAVIKDYRRVGLGFYLMSQIIRTTKRKLRIKIIRLGVLPTNEPAIKLYKKCGFKEVARIPHQFLYKGKLRAEIVMLKYL